MSSSVGKVCLTSIQAALQSLVFELGNLCDHCSNHGQCSSCCFIRRTGYFHSDTGPSNSLSKAGELREVRKYTNGFKHTVTLCKGNTWRRPGQGPVKLQQASFSFGWTVRFARLDHVRIPCTFSPSQYHVCNVHWLERPDPAYLSIENLYIL